jgi:hypothetical protein
MSEHTATGRTADTNAHTGEAHAGKPRGHGRWHFIRHYLEMVAAMFVGMFVFGAIVRGVLGLTDIDYTLDRYPEVMTLEMAATMALGMALWMRFRGHGWAVTLEMCLAMFVPAIVLFPLLWLGALTAGGLMMWEHVLMLALMLLVMLRRRAEYGL